MCSIPRLKEVMREILPELLYAALALIVTWLTFWWWKNNRQLPPGPWGLPLLGYVPFIKTPHLDYCRLAAQYGDVFSFRTVGSQLFVILNSSKAIKEVLVNRADEFNNRLPKNNLLNWLSDGQGIAQEVGEVWSEHRKFFLQTAKSLGFGKMEVEGRIHDEVRRMLTDMRSESKNQCVRLSDHVSYVANSTISHVLFNRSFKKDETFKKHVSNMDKFIATFNGYPNLLVGIPFEIFFAWFTNANQRRVELRKFSDSMVAERIRVRDSDNPEGFVDCFLNQREDLIKKGHKDGGTFTISRLEATAWNMYFAFESTGCTAVGLLLELSKHSSVQQMIQSELDSVVGRERLPSWGDRSNMPYLDACMQELYRVASQFPLTAIYSNTKETTIKGFRIPVHSAIVANLHSINQDPEIFPQPEKFEPNRFLDSSGKRIKVEGPYPFGLGKRTCIAESLAQMEVFIIITSVVQSFIMQPGDNDGTVRLIPRE
ncbi:hypothetical protein JTE90_021094 [Oedothorax gibbosus]|uniref:Cytochrome P450 n=2 Tax=Oedothorax gibbosus TaxID=931172 RepID=A0AAV6TXG9_9ARAC|nr:hypothetical protein JTE90_021094 [Oedothorax gibbosus]